MYTCMRTLCNVSCFKRSTYLKYTVSNEKSKPTTNNIVGRTRTSIVQIFSKEGFFVAFTKNVFLISYSLRDFMRDPHFSNHRKL